MEIQWKESDLIIRTEGEGERRVLESVVSSLSGLKRVDLRHGVPSGTVGNVDPVDNQAISVSANEVLEVVPQASR